jgi:acylphosphatase
MKRNLYLAMLAGVLFLLGACKKDDDDNNNNNPIVPPVQEIEVAETQKALFIDITATWCGPCGVSGTPLFREIIAENAAKVLAIAVHAHSSDLTSYVVNHDDGKVYARAYGAVTSLLNWAKPSDGKYYYPTYVLNQNYIDRSKFTVANAIDMATSAGPVANVGMRITQTSPSAVSIETRTKFFQAAEGEYYLSIYFIEDDIIHRQNVSGVGYDANYEHDHILRGILTDDPINAFATGEMIASGSISANADYKKTFTYNHRYDDFFKLPSETAYENIEPWDWNPAKTIVMAIIWKKVGDAYTFVNGEAKAMVQ